MARNFPRSAASFFAGLAVKSCTFDLDEAMEESGRTGKGEVLTADTGARLWGGTVTLARMNFDDAAAAKALCSTLRQAGRSFYVYDLTKQAPRKDLTGVLLGAATPTLASIASDNRVIGLAGLPAAYPLSVGDYLAFPYGTSPVRYALHQLAVGANASGAGAATIEVSSFIREGAVTGVAITLLKAFCKAQIVPGTFNPGVAEDNSVTGMSFNWRQTLR